MLMLHVFMNHQYASFVFHITMNLFVIITIK